MSFNKRIEKLIYSIAKSLVVRRRDCLFFEPVQWCFEDCLTWVRKTAFLMGSRISYTSCWIRSC